MGMSRRESRVSHTEGVTLLAHASPVPSRPIKYPIHVPTSLVRAKSNGWAADAAIGGWL